MTSLLNNQRRDNAVRHVTLFISTGVPSGAAMGNAWVLHLATQNGFDDLGLLSGLDYAAEQDWLIVGRQELLLTEAGTAATASG